MSGHIGNQNPDVFLIHDDEVVEISGDRGHGDVARSNVQTFDLRNLGWKNRQLDLTRCFQFLLDREQLLCELFADPTKHEVGLHPRLYDCW